jgi:hypothetical protein
MMNKTDSYKPPIEVQANARRALEYRAKVPVSKRGMTAVGIARARDLSNGRPQSLDVIQRMVSFFARHAVDKQADNWEVGSKGWQAWMAWGGDAGRRWAERIMADTMKDEAPVKKSIPTITSAPVVPIVTVAAPPAPDTSAVDGDDSSMAIGQMRAIADKAQKVSQVLRPDTHLESWVQSLVTEAADKVGIVHDYVLYGRNNTEKRMNKSLIQKNHTFGGEGSLVGNFVKFATFEKASKDQQVVVGYASSERIDGQNDIVDSDALKGALDDYMQWANLREMHQPKAIGKVLSAVPVHGQVRLSDGTVLTNPLRIIAKIVDEDAWNKVKAGVLKGFSIGGKVVNAITQKVNGKDVRRITGLVLNEISLVDRPANPDARIVMLKRDYSMDKEAIAADVKSGKVDQIILKAKAADPSEILPLIQQLRNQAEIDGDLDTAERYNEVITLMLEAMGIIPTGTVRDIDNMETRDYPGDDAPADLADMESLYSTSNPSDDTSKRRNTIMYSATATDIMKVGRAISSGNMETLSDIARAAKIILTLCDKLGVQMADEEEAEGAEETAEGESPDTGTLDDSGTIDMEANPPTVVLDVKPLPASAPAANEPSVMDALANAPIKPMPGNNSGAPIHTAMNPKAPPHMPEEMNPNAPAQNVKGGYPIKRSAQTGDLAKSADTAGDAVDITSLNKEMQSMENPVDNATPVADETVDVSKASGTAQPSIDVSAALQDVIAKSLQGVLAGTVAQLDAVAKAVDRIETKSAEQTTAVWDALKPLSETATATKDMVTPLVEKVAALEGVADSVKQLTERLSALENQPVDSAGAPVLRGQTVSKSIVGDTKGEAPIDEVGTLIKMIDETHDPLVRTKLRERLSLLQTKQALFGRVN